MSEIFEYWPEDLVDNLPESPLVILRKAASELSKATKGAVEGQLVLDETYSQPRSTRYEFDIVSKALNFRYTLFTAIVDPILLYPVEGWHENLVFVANSAIELASAVRELTLSPVTVRTIKALVAQSEAA